MQVLDLTTDAVAFLTPRLRAEDVEELTALRADGDVEAAVQEAIERDGVFFCLADDQGEPIVMGGFWHGMASWLMDSWLVASARIKEIGVPMARTVTKMHNELQAGGHIRRIQTGCILRDGNPKEQTTRRWLKFLGYEEEGIMRSYGAQGQSYIMMARIRT
jgi:hypothetical protein